MNDRNDHKWSQIIKAVRTPAKNGRLLIAPTLRAGDFDSHGVDCAFPFAHEGGYLMTYVGWDGRGYRTGLASSPDLLHWTREGLLIDRGPAGSVTEHNVALTSILRDNDLFGSGTLRRADGQYVGTYHAYPGAGYEEGPAVIGLCRSTDLRDWQLDPPFLSARDGAPWEAGGLYKSWLLEHDGTYYLFYNAKTVGGPGGWIEQTGLVTSPDLQRWRRHPANPLLPAGAPGAFDDLFASDPCVLRHGDGWLMFYFGNSSDGHARESVAFSTDLIHWTKSGEILVDVGTLGAVDDWHAHKPGMIASPDGRLHHFYTAVGRHPTRTIGGVTFTEQRGIAVAAR